MASAVDSETELKCPICFQDYRSRKLPGCVHCFCENCILTFVLNLKKENKLGQEFECPVCRLPSRTPEDDDITIEWVRKMDNNTEICNKIKAVELDNSTKWCTECKYVNKSVQSDIYCLNCQDSLCSGCSEILHSFKMNSGHSIVNFADRDSCHSYEQTLKMLNSCIKCSEHPDKAVVFVCEDDNELHCVACAVDSHRTCRNLKQISDITSHVSDDGSAKLVSTASNLKKHIQNVICAIKENDSENKNNLASIRCDIQEVKQKVVRILDAMEDNLIVDGKALVKEITITHLDEIQELDSITSTLEQIQYFVEKIITKLLPDQAYICIHELQRVVHDLEKRIRENWSTRKALGIEFKTTDILNSVQNLGVNETSQLGSIGQTEAVVILPSFEKATLPRKIRPKKEAVYTILPKNGPGNYPTYNCVIFLRNNFIFLVDSYYGFCCLADSMKNPIGSCCLFPKPYDSDKYFGNLRYATYMGNDLIAIGIHDEKKMCLVTSDKNLTTKMEIAFRYKPKALHGLRNSDIAVCWDDPIAFGIMRCQLWTYYEKVYFTQDKAGRRFKSFEYMAIDEERRHVVQPCTVDKAVYCFGFEGQPIFKYTNTELRDPRGVAVDDAGSIYVCDLTGGCIHVLSSDGRVIQMIKEICPTKPLAIGFSLDSKSFAVTENGNSWDSVHFYSQIDPNDRGKLNRNPHVSTIQYNGSERYKTVNPKQVQRQFVTANNNYYTRQPYQNQYHQSQ